MPATSVDKRGHDAGEVNDLLRKDIELIEAAK
jgi:hypothetical protein